MTESPVLSGEQLLERFSALDTFLIAHQDLWRGKPFTDPQLPWMNQYPQLTSWLRSRSLAQAEAAHNHPELLDAPGPFAELAQQAFRLSALGDHPQQPLPPLPARFSVDVPGRKWLQVHAFASSLQFSQPPQHWLDWCAGKGHLGRVLTQRGGELTCLELDQQLVEDGQRLSERLGIRAKHQQQDVLAADAELQLKPSHTLVALHACGDLHTHLLKLASASSCTQLAIAPCCYNRISSATYQPLSQEGQRSNLKLSKDDLSLPLNETVTAGLRTRQQRDLSMARRLGFDLLQRQLRGIDEYLPTPSLPSAWLHKPYADYCYELARLKHLEVPQTIDWHSIEAAGWQRLAEVRNFELVRQLFRRPLELWLLLDCALFLQGQAYQVRLGRFCPTKLSPRNLLLVAERK